MKKFLLIFSGALLGTIFIACNGNKQSKDALKDSTANNIQAVADAGPDPCDGIEQIDLCTGGRGIDNLIINEPEGRTMIDDFRDIYRRVPGTGEVIQALDSVYWLNACAVLAIENLLKNTKNPDGTLKYDGIRIHLACDLEPNPVAFPGQRYKFRSAAYIFPTMRRDRPVAGKSDHIDHRIKITLPGGCSSPLLEANAIANPRILKFDAVYRQIAPIPNLALSQSVWVESCVVYALAALLRIPNANLDGVNINLAAYSTLDVARTPGQFDARQSTAILIPTSLKAGKHENNWPIVDCLKSRAKALGWAPGGINHGELCPQQCE